MSVPDAGLLYIYCKIANTKNTNECKIRKTGLRIPDVCTKDMKKTRIINNVLISLETAAKRGRIRVLYSLHVIRNTPSDSLQWRRAGSRLNLAHRDSNMMPEADALALSSSVFDSQVTEDRERYWNADILDSVRTV